MNSDVVANIVHSCMPSKLYCKPGAVLVSGANTLTAGPVYVLGLNPGGDPVRIPRPIIESVAPPDGTSSYTHDCWQPKCSEAQPCSHLDSEGLIKRQFLVRHQRNMIALCATLGATPQTLFSANAVFARSTAKATLREQTGLSLAEWWSACWPVHQQFLAIVRPRLIVTLGYGMASSAFGLLHSQSDFRSPAPVVDEGRRSGWTFDALLTLSGRDTLSTRVVGVPHPSYFALGPLLEARLRTLVIER